MISRREWPKNRCLLKERDSGVCIPGLHDCQEDLRFVSSSREFLLPLLTQLFTDLHLARSDSFLLGNVVKFWSDFVETFKYVPFPHQKRRHKNEKSNMNKMF